MAEDRTSALVLLVIALVLLCVSALASTAIWMLGTGAPGQTLFGVFFVALHAGVAVFIFASPPKRTWIAAIAAALIVPTEVGVIALVGYTDRAMKHVLTEPEQVCSQKCKERGLRHEYSVQRCRCFN
jgi:uncharacterized RDD family membrane protein YckC